MKVIHWSKQYCYGLAVSLVAVMAAGCGTQAAAPPSMAVVVKAMKVIQRDTPVTYEFVGQVEAKNEVQIRAKVSGNIVGRMVTGGVAVTKGQPLFQIDRRQYESAMLAARAQLAQAEAALANSRLDVARYKTLAGQQAIAEQVLDNALAVEQQDEAQVEAYQARLQQAEDDLADTLIVSPVSGRIDVNTLSAGTFVQPGVNLLATVSSIDPVLVSFSMSENEYLRFARLGQKSSWGQGLKLVLSDGSEYPITGKMEQMDRSLSQDGTIIFKAAFSNSQGILVPGMFARVIAQGEIRHQALLVPQRAVQQMLGKTFVTVVAEGDKAESRPVTMGPRVGDLWLVETGLKAGDRVIVEGFLKTPPGTPLNVSMIGLGDLQAAKPNTAGQ